MVTGKGTRDVGARPFFLGRPQNRDGNDAAALLRWIERAGAIGRTGRSACATGGFARGFSQDAVRAEQAPPLQSEWLTGGFYLRFVLRGWRRDTAGASKPPGRQCSQIADRRQAKRQVYLNGPRQAREPWYPREHSLQPATERALKEDPESLPRAIALFRRP